MRRACIPEPGARALFAIAIALGACSNHRAQHASTANAGNAGRNRSSGGGANAAGRGGAGSAGRAGSPGANGGTAPAGAGGAAGRSNAGAGAAGTGSSAGNGAGGGRAPDASTDADGSAGAGAGGAVAYPVKRSADGRYLVDQNDRPYLLAGDAPQSLIVNLSEDEAEMYFANRERHGFNAAWVNLLCADYTAGRSDATTFDGIAPFSTSGDLATPNEAYFARADRMLESAARHGINLLLIPAETGSFLKLLVANGAGKARAFGQYLGARYQSFDNLIWMSGNDFQDWRTQGNEDVVKALAQGIRDRDGRHIHTIELDYPTSSSSDDADFLPLLELDAAYTYYPTYAQVLKSYGRANPLPVFLVEGVYEYESNLQAHESTPATLRRQEYWTNLSGATGQLYGNHYTWTFASGWKDKLDSPGAVQMAHVKALFEPRAWHELVPDQDHSVVTAGYGTFSASGHVDDSDYVTAARTKDGSLVMAYTPGKATLELDLTKLRGSATARWFDPSNGSFSDIAGSPFANSGKHSFSTPGKNADGDEDWVLVLEVR